MAKQDTFKIGLCMAGAISAGAYTAGVMDYLIEALEAWQEQKSSGRDDIPSHQVEIPIMGGASAGGMTAIIAAAGLYGSIEPVPTLTGSLFDEIKTNTFYHSWVDLVGTDMLSVMLDNSDLDKSNLKSVLNADFIDAIADRAIKVGGNALPKRKYIAENLRLFVTLSNLEGMDFSITFKSNTFDSERYVVTDHSDFACFRLVETESDYKNDGWMPLNFKSGLHAQLAKDIAIATGAFPVGFPARGIVREGRFLNDHPWFDFITKNARKPFPDSYATLNIDGGAINNEPFEKVREVIMEETGYHSEMGDYSGADPTNYDTFRGTVLMIDPFPSEERTFNSSDALTAVMGNTLSTLLDQARIKPTALIDAMDSNNPAQYLIAPVRYALSHGAEEAIEGKYAIACGSMGGFGGFINKEFRVHDYFLGRMNCEKFLRDYFTVPADTKNPIFVEGYKNVVDKGRFMSSDGRLQIIPIFSPRKPKGYMPVFSNGSSYPTLKAKQVTAYKKKLKGRVQKLLMHITAYSLVEKVLIWIGAKVVLNGKIANAVLNTVTKSLKEHQLLD